MKKSNRTAVIFTVLFSAVLVFSACNQIGGDYVNKPKDPTALKYFKDFEQNLSAVYLPAGGAVTFKIGIDDSADAKLESSFKIGKTAVTKELWAKVYDWATDPELAVKENRQVYKFSAKAYKGAVKVELNNPVTEITYLDSMVWCNALTEYLNFIYKDEKTWVDLYPVYYTKGSEDSFEAFFKKNKNDRKRFYSFAEEGVEPLSKRVLRESYTPEAESEGMEFVEYCGFNGYRLPMDTEWEFAARLTDVNVNAVPLQNFVMDGNTYYFTKGNSLSGARYSWNDSANGAAENGKVAVFGIPNAGGTSGLTEAAQVKTKDANTLGLYDMSGNVWEWTLPQKERRIVLKSDKVLNDDYPYANVSGEGRRKGGSFMSVNAQELCVGFPGTFVMKKDDTDKIKKWANKDIGFRIAKSPVERLPF